MKLVVGIDRDSQVKNVNIFPSESACGLEFRMSDLLLFLQMFDEDISSKFVLYSMED